MASISNSPGLSRVSNANQRRIPLGDIPNAANSPRRPSAAIKRLRLDPEAKEDFGIDEQRPAKRQALTAKRLAPRTPRRQPAPLAGEGIFEEKKTTQPTAFERRLRAAKETADRERQPQQHQERQSRSEEQVAEEIRAWRRSTQRAFPSFVFYFEGIPDETRRRCSRIVRGLGAVSCHKKETAIYIAITNTGIERRTLLLARDYACHHDQISPSRKRGYEPYRCRYHVP